MDWQKNLRREECISSASFELMGETGSPLDAMDCLGEAGISHDHGRE